MLIQQAFPSPLTALNSKKGFFFLKNSPYRCPEAIKIAATCILFSANFITVLLVMDFVANFIQANAF